MNAERLLQHYERIADAPDAIARLRRFILDLAVRGKLVPQDANDEPASELLKRIAKEKARLVNAGEIRKPPTVEPITDADALYSLPRTWAWVRVGNIFNYDAGTKRDPKELDQSRWLLELEDIEKDTSRIVERLRVSDRDSQSTKSEFEPGDILYGKLRPYLNKVVVADEPGYSTTEIVAIRPFLRLCPDYCVLAFRRPDFVAYVERLGRGTKMPRLRTPDAIVAPFPLPPLAEQHRIVAKVDALMALCDRLEAAREAREATRDRLAAASLARLNAPDTKASPAKVGTGFASGDASENESAFQADARFALDALPALTTRPDQIKRLRQTILNLAVRGKLVPQDANDEPASELLKRIAKEKARLVNAGEIRKEKPLPPLTEADATFELPRGWEWVRLGHLSLMVTSGSRDWAKRYANEGAIFVRMGNLSKDHYRLRLDHIQHVKPPADGEGTRTRLAAGDMLISITGEVGMLGLIPEGFGEAYINQHTAMVRPIDEIKGHYLPELFRSPFAQAQFNEPQRGIKNSFRLPDITRLVVPLPPLAEQHRIVAKVDELMGLCDRLEASLTATAATRRRLLDALLAEALTPVDGRELEAAE